METQLREAMLTGDVRTLDALLAEDLAFTNQAGCRLAKSDNLAAHRSGRLKLSRVDMIDRALRPAGMCVVVTLVAHLGGSFDSISFSGRFAYTRVWELAGGRWRVVAAHCSEVQ